MENNRLPQANPEVLTETECARRLSVGRETLSSWRHEGRLPYVPLSGGPKPRIRYIWSDVAAWVQAWPKGQGGNPPSACAGRIDQPAPPDGGGSSGTNIEFVTEAECAARISVRRETLSRWRSRRGMPFNPLGEGDVPRIRYVWPDVVAWLRAQSRNLVLAPPPRRRGRPRNVDRPRKRDDGRSA